MAIYQRQRYLFMTTDPVHIGTGSYRLGRVDNSIVREPGTNVPKIPGTSIHGAVRSYAARQFENLAAAGQNQKNVKYPATDPICYTFGYLRKEEGKGSDKNTIGYSGVVNVFDARVLFFPVHSMAGPVWVSCPERLNDAGFTLEGLPQSWNKENALFTWERNDPLNLGWLMLGPGGRVRIKAPSIWQNEERWEVIKNTIVLVNEGIFSQIVNTNLEVRTSVSIDPERGAAEDGALFTYEALPRATFLSMDAILDDYRLSFPGQSRLEGWLKEDGSDISEDERKHLKKQGWTDESAKYTLTALTRLKLKWSDPTNVLQSGLNAIEWLGVGGMGTRGFGRIAVVGQPLIS